MTTNRTPTGEKLDEIFKVVVNEAHTNKAFAARLRAALDGAQSPGANATTTRKAERATSAPDLHAVNVLRQHGEQMLRGRLSNLRTKTDLIQVARRSGLRLTGKSANKSATRSELIDGIIEAATQYDSQRQSVAG